MKELACPECILRTKNATYIVYSHEYNEIIAYLKKIDYKILGEEKPEGPLTFRPVTNAILELET